MKTDSPSSLNMYESCHAGVLVYIMYFYVHIQAINITPRFQRIIKYQNIAFYLVSVTEFDRL